jgi:hypothetical protein
VTVVTAPRRRIDLASLIGLTVAVVGWSMVAWLAARGFNTNPPTAGFDLELVLEAGRDVARGMSPYAPSIVAGSAPEAVGLFFAYPPVVAQMLAPFAGVPAGFMFLAWSAGAVAGLFLVGARLGHRLGASPRDVAVAALAAGAITFPFVVAILFGNVDAFFPALYGLALMAAISPRAADHRIGGIAIAIATVTKIYPIGLGLWFGIRAVRDRRRGADPAGNAVTFGTFVVAGTAVAVASVLVGGVDRWQEYFRVLSVAGRAELVDPRNIGPAAQVALALGASSDVARFLHLPVVVAAMTGTIWASWTRRDAVESLAIAAACSLILLPVTWIHYPAALLPFGLVAASRARSLAGGARIAALLALSVGLSIVALVWLPLLWIGVGALLAAVHLSIRVVAEDSAE